MSTSTRTPRAPMNVPIRTLRRPRLALALAVLLAAFPTGITAQLPLAVAEAPAHGRHSPAVEAGRAVVAQLMRDHSIPGMSVSVSVGDTIVWSEGFGFADLENRVPATPLTRFRIGSVSKTVTAAALGRLHQEGRLDLDAPVQRYVPGFPRKRWPITTRQLGGHLAGIRHYRGDEMLSTRHFPTVTEGLVIFRDDPLEHEPGTRYLYSSYGWNLLSAVVEGASGRDFLSYMREAVFAPLGLRSIVAEHVDSIIPYRARFYELDARSARVRNAAYVDNSYKWAGGGFVSNTEDLVRFGAAHLGGALLKPETVRLLQSSQRTRAGEETAYGIGWRSGRDAAGRRWVGHTGSSTGGRAVLLVFPEERVTVAALANLGSAPLSPELGQRLAEGFLAAARRP